MIKVNPYDYTALKNYIKNMKGFDKNKIEYIETALEMLSTEYLRIAEYLGRLDGVKMFAGTVSGRKSLDMSDQSIIASLGERQKAESALKLIDEIIRLTKKKVEYMIEY